MITIVFRTITLYGLILFVMRVMGKRQLGELQPFELVITLIIANLAQTPLANTGVPLLYGVLPILTLFVIHELSALLIMKSKWVGRVMCGRPSIVIDKGIICVKELKKMRYTVIDLIEQLRTMSIMNVQDVEYAILETNGELSVVKKSGKDLARIEDLKIAAPPAELVLAVVIDGSIMAESLKQKNRTKEWLKEFLQKQRIDLKDVMLAQLGDQELSIQFKAPKARWKVVKVA